MANEKPSYELTDEFMTQIAQHGPKAPNMRTRCWIWRGTVGGDVGGEYGYHRGRRCNRIALESRLGRALRPRELALHRCQMSRLCCRPDHIAVGSQKKNIRQAAALGRMSYLLRRPKLSPEQAAEIRSAAGYTHQQLAEIYGVSRAHVTNIKRGFAWSSAANDNACVVARAA
jgi:hypothetical protein